MPETQATTSLAQHVRPLEAGAHVVAAAFIGDAPAVALADGAVLLGDAGQQKRVFAHPDAAILTAISGGATPLTGRGGGAGGAPAAAAAAPRNAPRKGAPSDARATHR